MSLEHDTYQRWEKERDSLRQQIAAMRDGDYTTHLDGRDIRLDTTDATIRDTEARLADIERMLAEHERWRPSE